MIKKLIIGNIIYTSTRFTTIFRTQRHKKNSEKIFYIFSEIFRELLQTGLSCHLFVTYQVVE